MFNFQLKRYKLKDTSLSSSCKELNTSATTVTTWRAEVAWVKLFLQLTKGNF